MGKEMMTWQEWEIAEEWSSSNICPVCGEPLIITEIIAHAPAITANLWDKRYSLYNGICPSCRRQYTVSDDTNTVTVNVEAVRQQDRIDALEERIARLEQRILALEQAKQANPVSTPIQQEDPEAADFKKKYGYLF